jgi:MSHA biogenesis protein MshP
MMAAGLRRHRASRPRVRERGFAIVGAFFLVVILGALGLYLSRITAQNQAGSALDIQGARAYQAANAGIEWAAARLLMVAAAPACFRDTTLSFVDSVLEPFTVSVSCSVTLLAEGGVDVSTYRVVANACNQPACPSDRPAEGYVERQVEATLARP